MKRISRSIAAAAILVGILISSACDWSSGSQDNFNTSGGSANVNVSGFYRGLNGGRIVANTSNGNIVSFTIQQSGNRVDVTDNQGSTYTGNIGAPLVSDDLSDGSIATGAVVASYQISFSGKDGVASRDINFNGVLTIVSVTDIQGRSGSSNSTLTSNSSTSTTGATPVNNSDGSTTTVTGPTGSSTSNSSESSSFNFSLSGPTTQLQLQGTWVEVGGVVSSVNGFGPPAQGNITVAATPAFP